MQRRRLASLGVGTVLTLLSIAPLFAQGALSEVNGVTTDQSGAVLPLGMVIALTALELLVAFLQAYVFAILTCIYLNEALHLHDHH